MEKTDFNFNGREITLRSHTFRLCALKASDIGDVLSVQNAVVERLFGNDILQPSTEEEILDSMAQDYCFGIYDGARLVAFNVIVLGRKTDRSLCPDWEEGANIPWEEYITFDSVQVHPDYRGYGMQKFFLELTESVAKHKGSRYIIATVSPDNPYSLNNFKALGYCVHPQKNPYSKYGSKRCLVRKEIK